jgi:hypothetical protein
LQGRKGASPCDFLSAKSRKFREFFLQKQGVRYPWLCSDRKWVSALGIPWWQGIFPVFTAGFLTNAPVTLGRWLDFSSLTPLFGGK